MQGADFEHPGVKGGQQTDELFKLGILFQAGIVVGNGLAAHQLGQGIHALFLIEGDFLLGNGQELLGTESQGADQNHRKEQGDQP